MKSVDLGLVCAFSDLLEFDWGCFFTGWDAGRGDGHVLDAALEEWLEALSILRGNQGRSQAAPLAASRQRTRCRDRPQPQRTSRILRDS